MKRLITMVLVASMVLSMTACGKKETSESSVASGSSVAASSAAESASKESKTAESTKEDKSAPAKKEEYVSPVKGESYEKLQFFNCRETGIRIDSPEPVVFEHMENPGIHAYVNYIYNDNTEVTLDLYEKPEELPFYGDEGSVKIVAPEGTYRSFYHVPTEMEPGAYQEYTFDTVGADGKQYVLSVDNYTSLDDTEENSSFFLQLVKNFLNSDIPVEKSMSNITYDNTQHALVLQ